MTINTDLVRAQAWAKLEREWAIDGMPADKIRLARAAFDAGAAIASAPPSAPVGVEGLLADLETIWHSVSDDKETNAAYQRLKAALAQQPAAPSAPVRVAGDGVDVDAIQHILRHALRDGVHGGYTAGFIENQIAALAAAHQQPAGVGGTATNSAVAAIQFALKDPEGMTFLRLWNEGEFDTLRREWPDAPVEVYINADPLAAQQHGGA